MDDRDKATSKPKVVNSEKDSTDFLVDEFGMKEGDAADLVASDTESAEELRKHAQEHRASRDDLAGVPTPKGSGGTGRVPDSDEDALKPVEHHRPANGS